MPTYEYKCQKCGEIGEVKSRERVVGKIDLSEVKAIPCECGGTMTRVFSTFGIRMS